MTYAAGMPRDLAPIDYGRLLRTFPLAATVMAAALLLDARLAGLHDLGLRLPALRTAAAPRVQNPYGALLDPHVFLGSGPATMAESAPLATSFRPRTASPEPVQIAAATAPAASDPERVAAVSLPVSPPPSLKLEADVPLPAPRPPELLARQAPAPARQPLRQLAQRNAATVPAAPKPDNRGFFEKFFGGDPQPGPRGPALAYAAPETDAIGGGWFGGSKTTVPDGQTAVYDISAHTVTLPNGTRLEAHSGLGTLLDDPRYVGERNRGATPPHVYDLELRAQLFHGVQALRLNPADGGNVFRPRGAPGPYLHAWPPTAIRTVASRSATTPPSFRRSATAR